MIDFLKIYYREIVIVFVFIVEFVFSFLTYFRTKKHESPILSYVLKILPDLIFKAESFFGAGSGIQKKQFVMSKVEDIFKSSCCDFDSISRDFISNAIENILSTPTKKEGR